jgi:predicted PurR-regulated permease PerM
MSTASRVPPPARPAHEPSPRPALPRVLAWLLGIVLAALVLKVGRPVLVPLVAGGFVAMLAHPLRCRLERALPRWLALVLTLLVVIAVLGAFATALTVSVRAVVGELAERREALEGALAQLRARVGQVGITLPGGGRAGGGGGGGATGAVTGALRTLLAGIGGLILTIAIAGLALAESGELRRRAARALGRHVGALDAADEAAVAFRRYVWVKSLTSLLTGTCSGLLAWAFGLPLAWVWGFLAFLLEYVPSVGSLVAVLPPSIMALAESAGGGGMGRPLAVFLAFGALQVLLGNVVDPRLEGKLMQLSPLGVLVSIVLWGWLWGPAGALLAVPMTVAIVIVSRRVRAARGVAVVIAGEEG